MLPIHVLRDETGDKENVTWKNTFFPKNEGKLVSCTKLSYYIVIKTMKEYLKGYRLF